MAILMGIDPGSQFTGYGVLVFEGHKIQHIAHGVIRIPKTLSFPEKLLQIALDLRQLLKAHQPSAVVVEKIFLGKNVDSAFKLGQVRGVCLLEAAALSMPCVEYATRQVKQCITGSGGADKDQVSWMLRRLLSIEGELPHDASDALALAFCHCRELDRQRVMETCL
jgi:crossover junction endodeoxyribonuclease RuvC